MVLLSSNDMPDKSLNDLVDSLRSSDTKIILTIMITQFEDFKQILGKKDEEIKKLSTEVAELKKCVEQVTGLKKKISSLESELDDVDSYERRDTLIFSGSNLPHGSLNENCIETIRKLASEKLQVNFDPREVSTAHRLGKLHTSGVDKRSIIVKFCRRDLARNLCSAARSKRPDGIFINETLTPLRRKLLFTLRQVKKAHPDKLSGCTSIEGKVYAYTKPSPNSPPNTPNIRTLVNSHEHLAAFCQGFIQQPLENFLAAQIRR